MMHRFLREIERDVNINDISIIILTNDTGSLNSKYFQNVRPIRSSTVAVSIK